MTDRLVVVDDPDGHGATVLASAPLSDTGQKAIAVRIISALGGAGGGGPATIADGGDVAQGTTSDVAWVSGAGTVISLLKKIASAGGSAVSIADGANTVEGTTTDVAGTSTIIGKLKSIANSLAGTLTTSVSNFPATQPVSGTVTATGPLTDTQLRATPVPVSGTVALSANTPDVTDRAARLLGVVDKGKVWDGTNIQTVKAGVVAVVGDNPAVVTLHPSSAPTAAQPITDNAGSLTVDAPVGTPAFVRLSDGAAAIATLPVSMATNTPDVTDRAARLLGHVTVDAAPTTAVTMATQTPDVTDRAARLLGVVDKGKVWDGTNIAAVKAASALAVATDPALVVQHSPQRADASILAVTTISAANTGVTLTLGAAGAGLFHYITSIEIVNVNATVTAIAAAATLLSYTTTNLPGNPVWNCGNLLAAGSEKVVTRLAPTTPLKASVAATNTTIVAPAIGTGGQCRITATYYTAP